MLSPEKNGLKRRNLMIQKSHKLLERYINSRLVYNMLDEQAWTEYLNQNDPAIAEAFRIFRQGKAFPQNQEQPEAKQKVAMAYDYRNTHIKTTVIARA